MGNQSARWKGVVSVCSPEYAQSTIPTDSHARAPAAFGDHFDFISFHGQLPQPCNQGHPISRRHLLARGRKLARLGSLRCFSASVSVSACMSLRAPFSTTSTPARHPGTKRRSPLQQPSAGPACRTLLTTRVCLLRARLPNVPTILRLPFFYRNCL